MSGHVPSHVDNMRADIRRAVDESDRDRPAPPLDAEVNRRGIDRCVAVLAAGRGLDLDSAEGEALWRRAVMAEGCPHCRAGASQPCTSGGRPLTQRLAHPGREEAARTELGVPSA